jgi:hypothetical protein
MKNIVLLTIYIAFLCNANTTKAQFVKINTPYENVYEAGKAISGMGADITTATWSGCVALVNDGVQPINDGCELPYNDAQLSGKIAIIDRGSGLSGCTHRIRSERAQTAGAIGLIFCNTDETVLQNYGLQTGSITVTIPIAYITKSACNEIKAALNAGNEVCVTMGNIIINYDIRVLKNLTFGPRHGAIPLSEIQNQDDYQLLGGMLILNQGLLPSSNVFTKYSLEKDGIEIHGFEFADSLPSLAAGDTSEIISDNILLSLPAETGKYKMIYTAESEETDQLQSNNSTTHEFSVTEETFAQCTVDNNGYPNVNSWVSPNFGADTANVWEYGPIFYVRHGVGHSFKSVVFKAKATTPSSMIGREILVRISYANIPATGPISETNFELINEYAYTFTQNDYDGNYIEVPVDVALEDGKAYYVSLFYPDGTALSIGTESAKADYGLYASNAALFTNQAGLELLPAALYAYNNGAPQWYSGFSNTNPAIAITLDQTLGYNETTSVKQAIKVYPNPVKNQINILLKENKGGFFTSKITDLSGKCLKVQQDRLKQNEILSIDLKGFNAGIYVLSLENENEILTHKIILSN